MGSSERRRPWRPRRATASPRKIYYLLFRARTRVNCYGTPKTTSSSSLRLASPTHGSCRGCSCVPAGKWWCLLYINTCVKVVYKQTDFIFAALPSLRSIFRIIYSAERTKFANVRAYQCEEPDDTCPSPSSVQYGL